MMNSISRMVGAISGPELTQGSQGGSLSLWFTKYTIYKTICLFLIIYNSTTYNKK